MCTREQRVSLCSMWLRQVLLYYSLCFVINISFLLGYKQKGDIFEPISYGNVFLVCFLFAVDQEAIAGVVHTVARRAANGFPMMSPKVAMPRCVKNVMTALPIKVVAQIVNKTIRM